MAKIITFATLKGGTGKTTSAFSTAGILSERGNKVLVIDVDPQANITSDMCIDETEEEFIGIKEILSDDKIDPEKVVMKAPIEELPTLDIIPASIALTSTEIRITSFAGREYQLRKYLRKNKSFFDEYDYIIIDTNPSMSVINQNSFVISDAIIVVSDIGINSLKGLELFVALWEDILDRLDLENNIKGLLVNKFNKNSRLSKEFIEYCEEEEEINKLLFRSRIPIHEKLQECELERKPINVLDKETEVYREFNAFVDELISRL